MLKKSLVSALGPKAFGIQVRIMTQLQEVLLNNSPNLQSLPSNAHFSFYFN
jgi:hypothetical protein